MKRRRGIVVGSRDLIGWAIEHDGKLVPGTLSESQASCWELGFWKVASVLGEKWRAKYWKRWNPSRRSAARHGFKVVAVVVYKAEQ